METTALYIDSESTTYFENLSAKSNPDDEKQPMFNISEQFLEDYIFILNVILGPCVCVIGIFGNSLGLYVLFKDPKRAEVPIFLYLLCLLLSDIIYLLSALFSCVVDVISVYNHNLGNYIRIHAERQVSFLDILFYHVTVYTLTIMSLERLMIITSPLKKRDFFLSRYPRLVVSVGLLLFLGYLVPWPICLKVATFQTKDNRTELGLKIKDGFEQLYQVIFTTETILLNYIAPVIVLAINALILFFFARYLRQKSKILELRRADSRNQVKITALVLVVCVFYLLLSVPSIFGQTLIMVDEDYGFRGRFKSHFFFFYHTGNFFTRFNAALDFYIYIVVSSRYRALIKFMIFNRCCNVNLSRASTSASPFKPSSEDAKKKY